MRIKLFLICFILLSVYLIGLTSNVVATKYKIGVDKGDEIIWKCNICDNEKMEDIFGEDWDTDGTGLFENLDEGTRMRWIIKDTEDDDKIYSVKTEDNETVLKIIYKKWKWTDDDNWGDKDYIGESTYFANPDDYDDELILSNFAPIWFPLPIDEYLKELDLYEGYSIDARVISAITCEIEKDDLKGDYPKEYVKIQAMYSDNGILSSYKLYIEDHKVIVDISLETILPHKLFILPAITALFYVGIIYIIYKKILKT